MAFPGEIGWIGKNCPDHPTIPLETKIMQSAAGYFLGTQCPACRLEDPSPHSRETDYYASRVGIKAAFIQNKLRWRNDRFTPTPLEIRYILEALQK